MKTFKFHLSLPTTALGLTKQFYTEKLGCKLGRTGAKWADVDLFGHQITFTAAGDYDFQCKQYAFEDKVLPAFHFGILLDSNDWREVFEKTKEESFMWMMPKTFLQDKVGEHKSFFIEDPNGYIIEFKSFSNTEEVFHHT